MKFKPCTVDNVCEVLERIRVRTKSGTKADRVRMAEAVNEWLDGLLEQDFFGTEGQLDPRGDHRD